MHNKQILAGINELWGQDASPPARYFTRKILAQNSKILEIGARCGKDSNWFAENGHKVTAIDRCPNALAVASAELHSKIRSRDVVYIAADFRDAAIGTKSQDAFFSHRVLHLLGNNGVVEAFAGMAAKVLRPEGKLLVTARNYDDFNPDQMQWISEEQGIAKYRNDIPEFATRQGHNLYFWNEYKLDKLFSADFENISIINDDEIESQRNHDDSGTPVMTKYVSILATRKYTPPSPARI